jgi:hypothetical protein
MGLPQLNRNEDTMGRKKYTIEGQARHTHFTWEQRLQLQYHYTGANGYKKLRSPLLLGKLLGKHGLKRESLKNSWSCEIFSKSVSR